MKTGFKGILDEAEDLKSRWQHFSLDPQGEIAWDEKQKNIKFIEKLKI